MEPEAGPSKPVRTPSQPRRRETGRDASDKAVIKSLASSPAFMYLRPRSLGLMTEQDNLSGTGEATPKRMLPYRTDEQCRIRCKQTNARR